MCECGKAICACGKVQYYEQTVGGGGGAYQHPPLPPDATYFWERTRKEGQTSNLQAPISTSRALGSNACVFPSGWCFSAVTTGWIFWNSLCENSIKSISINQSIKPGHEYGEGCILSDHHNSLTLLCGMEMETPGHSRSYKLRGTGEFMENLWIFSPTAEADRP